MVPRFYLLVTFLGFASFCATMQMSNQTAAFLPTIWKSIHVCLWPKQSPNSNENSADRAGPRLSVYFLLLPRRMLVLLNAEQSFQVRSADTAQWTQMHLSQGWHCTWRDLNVALFLRALVFPPFDTFPKGCPFDEPHKSEQYHSDHRFGCVFALRLVDS